MTVYAYLRVSTEKQELENQKYGIEKYAQQMGFSDIVYYEDIVSGWKKSWKERGLGKLILNVRRGDIILISEISRIGRTTLQVLEFLQAASEIGVVVHVVKSGFKMDGSISSRLLAMVLGFASEIEREFISTRTREALANRRAKGLPVGRPKGSVSQKKLSAHHQEIGRWLRIGIPKVTIARLLECSVSSLYGYISTDPEYQHFIGKTSEGENHAD